MKRVAVIAITMAIMASLFAFPVFADTPVQPLQVITYSDTTTNVRISGTAERLHYNVDSFQVVFMSPPNNYGTACTPVLVSFRFYNASDLPAYVGQPEFELTATTGTGSVNTIIYGYDQISTDLFVAESSYSTAEVGRIGIGASNDFAYYTGFVIPPRTSLYFSCIVYVNASAYAQNNTGATEDVNQVTLSSLNLYSNQISFSADYPYHNQPIDFSDIIESISDLADIVSTSSEMQDLIDVLTYSGSTNVNINTNVYNYSNTSATYNGVTIQVDRYIFNSYINYRDYELDTTNDNLIDNYDVVYPVLFKIRIDNPNTYEMLCNQQSISINGALPGVANYVLVHMYSNFAEIPWFHENAPNTVQVIFDTVENGKGILSPGSSFLYIYYERHITGNSNPPSYGNMSLAYRTFTQYQSDVSSGSDEIADKSSQAHTQEQSYFTQNAQAIQDTGLSNYRFNGDQENGIGSVSHDFTLLWNALGGFNSVYIFSLTLSLALMVLRHAPGVIRSSRRNKEE